METAHYCEEMQNSWYFHYENRNQYSQANQTSTLANWRYSTVLIPTSGLGRCQHRYPNLSLADTNTDTHIWAWPIPIPTSGNRIYVCGLWQGFQFDIGTWKCRRRIISTKSYCRVVLNQVWTEFICVTCGKSFNLTTGLESAGDMNYLHKVILKCSLNQRANKIPLWGLWQKDHFDIWTWN